MTITKTMIEERILVLNTDIDKINTKLRDLEQQRIENIALLNALMGAKQQCDNFLQELDNVGPEVVSDSSDVDK